MLDGGSDGQGDPMIGPHVHMGPIKILEYNCKYVFYLNVATPSNVSLSRFSQPSLVGGRLTAPTELDPTGAR